MSYRSNSHKHIVNGKNDKGLRERFENVSYHEGNSDDDKSDLQSDYSIQAVGSYSPLSATSFHLKNEEDEDSDGEHCYREAEDELVSEVQIKSRNIQELMKNMRHIDKRKQPLNEAIKIKNYDNNDGDYDTDDILQQWRRRRRLEKLKLEHNRKQPDLDGLEKLNNLLAMNKAVNDESPLIDIPPFPPWDKRVSQQHTQTYHSHSQEHKHHDHPMCHNLLNHPLKIHLSNISRCCKCYPSRLPLNEVKNQPIRISKWHDHAGGGDEAMHDPPTKDAGIAEVSTGNAQAQKINSQCAFIIEHRCPVTSQEKKQNFLLVRPLDNKVVEAQAQIISRSGTSSKGLIQSKCPGFGDQLKCMHETQQKSELLEFQLKHGGHNKDLSLKNKCNNSTLMRGLKSGTNVHESQSQPQIVNDLDISFSTISSFSTDNGCDEVLYEKQMQIKSSNPENKLPSMSNGLTRPSKVSKLVENEVLPGNVGHYPDSGHAMNNIKSSTLIVTNVSPSAEIASDALSDIESLLEMSDEEEFPEDEILRGLRIKRKKCLEMVKKLNIMVPP